MEVSITIRRGRDTYVSNINIADDADAARVLAGELAEIQKQFLKRPDADRRTEKPRVAPQGAITTGETK